jgi:hypothetical protein
MNPFYELLYTGIEDKKRDSKSPVKTLKRQAPTSSIILSILVLALLASNIYMIQTRETQREYLRDSLALTQNGYENLFKEFDELLEDSDLTNEELEDLESWVERTSILSATITYQDKHHFDLWAESSERLEDFECLLEDLETALQIQELDNKMTYLSEDNFERLEMVESCLKEYYAVVFPGDVLTAGSIWMTPHYTEYDSAFEALMRFSEAVGEAWMILPSVNQVLQGSPDEQAKNLIISSVGADYFSQYFTQWKVERNTHEPDEWLTAVGYFYHIEVGNYSARREISIYFDKMNNLTRAETIPSEGNLMPFSVSEDEALSIAENKIPRSYVDVEAEIYYKKKTYSDHYIGRYVWVVNFYHTPKNAPNGSLTSVYVDPLTREIYGVETASWESS